MLTIEVASAIITRVNERNEKELLLTLRKLEQPYGNLWECPGGKVEPFEFRWKAVEREIREELGVDGVAQSMEAVAMLTCHSPVVGRRFRIWFFECNITGEPKPLAAQRLFWFDKAGFQALIPDKRLILGNRLLADWMLEYLWP